jgi:ribosome-binding protein aMBF1 (putative translation factor)
MKCNLCGKETTRFFRVNHPDHQIIFICEECYRTEHDRLLPLPDEGCSGCCYW